KTKVDFLEINKLNKSDHYDVIYKSYYFYSYFNVYLKAAAINNQIDNLYFY
ncbi:21131_t:CDS:1, partial [Cetraspora pellucida]